MTTKWTPAPWKVESDWSQTTGDCFYISNEKESEREANAQLIASAPALYEALDGILAITDRNHVAWEKARAALRQARGEQ